MRVGIEIMRRLALEVRYWRPFCLWMKCIESPSVQEICNLTSEKNINALFKKYSFQSHSARNFLFPRSQAGCIGNV